LKLQYNQLLSRCAFDFSLRRYSVGSTGAAQCVCAAAAPRDAAFPFGYYGRAGGRG